LFFNPELKVSAEMARTIMNARYDGYDVRFAAMSEKACGDLDFVLSIGGDGTFLRTAKAVMGTGVPLYGINTGRLGFLAAGQSSSAVSDVHKILSGDYRLAARFPLRGEAFRAGVSEGSLYALNEITIAKDFVSRPVGFSVGVGDENLYRFLSDGMIVSTPTGSTAYALSAGGPIVHPDVRCMLALPICPHSLYPRPIVLSDCETVTVKLESDSCGAILSGDGQNNMDLSPGDEVRITSDLGMRVDVVRFGNGSYIDVLRSKLNW
jgi:NAD+ kinase